MQTSTSMKLWLHLDVGHGEDKTVCINATRMESFYEAVCELCSGSYFNRANSYSFWLKAACQKVPFPPQKAVAEHRLA